MTTIRFVGHQMNFVSMLFVCKGLTLTFRASFGHMDFFYKRAKVHKCFIYAHAQLCSNQSGTNRKQNQIQNVANWSHLLKNYFYSNKIMHNTILGCGNLKCVRKTTGLFHSWFRFFWSVSLMKFCISKIKNYIFSKNAHKNQHSVLCQIRLRLKIVK